MKKLMTTLVLLMTIAISADAMSYSKARNQALFLTDKMGYELDLTDDQYNAVYEINLDYMMCIGVQGDLFGTYWIRRNNELEYVLSPYQYERFLATEYFYRPVSWISNAFHFIIYNKYERNRFYRNAPMVYQTYRGGNRLYHHSAYKGRTYANEPNRNVPNRSNAAPVQPEMSKRQAVKGGRQETQRRESAQRQGQNHQGPGGNQQHNQNHSGNRR